MLVHTWRLHHLGMYERSVVLPAYHFRYDVVLPGCDRLDGGAWAQAHLQLLAASSLGMALGVWTVGCASCFAVAYGYFVLADRTMFNNHYYLYGLISLLVALIGGADQTASLPRAWAWARARRSDGRRSSAPPLRPPLAAAAWHVWLLRLQVCAVYAYAGLAKINSDWLLHSQPMATKLAEEAVPYLPEYLPDAVAELVASPAAALLVSLGGAAFDLGAVPLLLCRRTRPLGLLLATAFHTANASLWSIGEFPAVMVATNLLFLDSLPAWPGGGPSPTSASPRLPPEATGKARGSYSPRPPPSRRERAARALGLVHAGVQLVLPLRPLLVHRGDTLDAVHTKSHTLLSWRMMAVSTRNFLNVSLRSEALGAAVTMTRTYNHFYLIERRGAARVPLPVPPQLELSPRQHGYMPYTAPMLARYARDAAAAHACDPAAGCALVGELWSSVNGRPLQRCARGRRPCGSRVWARALSVGTAGALAAGTSREPPS